MKTDYLLLICILTGVLPASVSYADSYANSFAKNVKTSAQTITLDLHSQDKTYSLNNSQSNNNDCQLCHAVDSHTDDSHTAGMSSYSSNDGLAQTVSANPVLVNPVSIQLAPGQEQACLECHAENDVSVHYIQLAQLAAPGDEVAKEESVSEPFKKASGKGPGMSLTMYYNESRLGDEPNKMVLIDAGKFTMGSNSRLPDEGPEHQLSLEKFWVDKFEVTNYQYKKFIDATSRRSPQHFENRTFPENKIDHPVVYVSWKDARAYCKWADKRLPTDQEWEKAARGDDVRIYPWGNVYDTDLVNSPQRWMELKLEGDTTPAGAFEGGKSPYGLYDMSGNVWEWTDSWYVAYPGNTDSSENYGQIYKTLKGGSWWDCSFYKCGISAPTFNRSFFLRSTKNKSFGFRCAKDTS